MSVGGRPHLSSQAFLELVLEGVPQPVWVVDEAGYILLANPAAVAALGYDDAKELRGKQSHETVHYKRPDGSPYPAAECSMLRTRVTGETVHGEDEWFVRRDGSMFPIAWWSAPIETAGGQGAVLVFNDISERLAAEQAARDRDAAEVRAAESRAAQRRILEGATAVRRGVARDLHDGAQQRLVNVLISVQLASEAAGGSPAAQALLGEASLQAQAAIDGLRELVAGVHPTGLTARGVGAAVEALAARSPLPVRVSSALARRLPAEVEASAYFVVAEALTNAGKHACASHVEIDLRLEDGRLEVVVRDDGVGGAQPDAAGTGLVGLGDRLDALDGALTVESPAGAGTVVRARIPVDEPADR